MSTESDPQQLLERLDLTEYEATALEALLTHGRSTAPNLVDATGIPNARIYGVLENLGNKGFIKVIPGRPKEYQPKPPEEVLDRAVEHRRQSFEEYRADIDAMSEEFLATFEPRYRDAAKDVTPTEELFYVVDVGEPSETETRAVYRDADHSVSVLTKSFEYFDAVETALADALDRGVDIDVLFLHPDHLSPENRAIQERIVERIRSSYPAVGIRFSEEQLPWRGTLADPSMDYETGTAILLVEEKDIPLHMRQAAVTENGSFVAGLQRYFDLIWEYESTEQAQ